MNFHLSVNKTNKDHAEKKSTVNDCKRALQQTKKCFIFTLQSDLAPN